MSYLYDLMIAILVQAKQDYIEALLKNDLYRIQECETFFLSEYGQAMSLYNGERIIELCKEIARKKGVKTITYNGETRTFAEWAKIKGLSAHALKERLKRGWSVEKALNTPLKEQRKNDLQNSGNGNTSKSY